VSEQGFYSVFSEYLSSGNAQLLEPWCVNPVHSNRLAVYRNGFYKSVIDALMANYPVCFLLLGEQLFRQIARAYVEQSPPQQATLVGYGEHFADFICDEMTGRVADDDLVRVAAAVAELDRSWLQSLSSAEPTQLLTADCIQELAGQGTDVTALPVSLSPSVSLCEVALSALQRWLALKAGSEVSPVKDSASVVTVMFWRLQGVVQVRALSAPETALMHSLQQVEASLEIAFSAVLAVDAKFDVSDLFTACLQNQLIDRPQH
jgi:hypothetical protein